MKKKIQQRDDYRKEICLDGGETSVYLFGSRALVKELQEEFEPLKKGYVVEPLKIELSEKQVSCTDDTVPLSLSDYSHFSSFR